MTDEQFTTLSQTQELLLPTLAAVQTYAKPQLGPSQGTRGLQEDLANPSSQFGLIGMGGPWNRRVVYIQATSTAADRQVHADALTRLVPRPDRTVVCPTALSEARAADIRSALYARFWPANQPSSILTSPFYGIDAFTDTNGRVGVHLRSDAVALAGQLRTQYGTDIVLALGNFSWPDPASPGPGTDIASRCGTVKTVDAPPVDWSLPRGIVVRTGAIFEVTARVRNPAPTAIRFTALKAVVTARGSRRVVANRAQQISYTADEKNLPPRTWTEVRPSPSP